MAMEGVAVEGVAVESVVMEGVAKCRQVVEQVPRTKGVVGWSRQ